ncbi:hypothetical protein [Kitasatospora fiedleri]|uniref:hypothetical protein n=1 Tax=Kitasatospora fiedleri TaxID=2991545 RepID=UPI00249B82A7|nr:hypothetical protein [Kitasatospora fiedleri]
MTQPRHAQGRICPNCDGFPRVAIATGTRRPDGSRTTAPVTCPACQGSGTVRRAALTAVQS